MTDSKSDLGLAGETLPEPVPGVDGLRYVGTFGWTDLYGRDRRLDIYAGSTLGDRVWVYGRQREVGEAPVATVPREGRFSWSPGQPAAAGVDTAAARNDLIETCRGVQLGPGGSDPDPRLTAT